MIKKLPFLLAILFIFNCENEPIAIFEQNQKLILKRVNYPLIDSPDNCSGRFADFDSQGKIIEVFYECDGNTTSFRTYTYTESGLINYFTGYLDFTYDENNVLIRRSGGTDTGFSYHDFFYNDNIMLVQGYYNGVQNYWYTTYEFEDDTFKKLLSIKSYDSSNNEEIIYRETYQYNGNNPIEILIEQKDLDDLMLEPKRQITITYDNKINPYRLGLPENAYMANSTMLAYDISYNIAFTADNNITSIIINNLVDNTVYTNTNTYSYNNDMYPIEAIFYINGEPFRKEIFEYYQ
jgi:hypothetical protein